MTDIKYVVGEDWQGLYVNSWLKIEGHTIPTYQAIHIIAKSCYGDIQTEEILVNQEWLEEQGNLPNRFSDIPENVIEKRRQ